eukprot:TRINITY_DN483_c1_g1_i4.p1 TRINITY_DN483_c1_g1~~TRINITY_DN483_c1_g1_i4.p1  ORF type:complete len:348 (-),score=114.30 TRINITY_DN483_c1_g1_i4:155-1198(-)
MDCSDNNNNQQQKERVIIDCDPGVDDTLALMLAFGSPEIQIEAITIVHGNSYDVNILARNACLILELLDKADIPVYIGCKDPLMREFDGHSGALFHGDNALGNIPVDKIREEFDLPNKKTPETDKTASEFIVDYCCNQHPNQISLITLGPLSNIGLALLIKPELVDFVNRISIMGGAVNHQGNITPIAEANIYNDDFAARSVFSSNWKEINMIGLNVTSHLRVDDNYLKGLNDIGNKSGKLIYQIVQFYKQAQIIHANLDTIPMHDPSAVMYHVRSDLFKDVRKARLYLECEGVLTKGLVIADFHGQFNQHQTEEQLSNHPFTNIPFEGVDFESYCQEFKDRISSLP